MEKCVYNGEVLYAYQVLQDFDFEQKIRNCRALRCCDCDAPVFFKHGKQRAECFAHYKREECKYGDYCSKQSNIFKYVQRELYIPLQRIAENRGFKLEEDVVIIHDHYTAFVLRGESVKYAIDIIDTAATSTTLDKRNRLYEEAGYRYLQITVDKDAESEPFSERDMAYFPVKYSLNKSLNHTAIVIDKERKNWFIYILDNMDTSDVPDNFYYYPDWFAYDAFAMPISLDDIDVGLHGFFTVDSNKAFTDFYNNRRTEKAKWIKEDANRRERQRKQAEEARKQAEIRRQEQERRFKEAETKRQQEAEEKKKAAEAARLQTTLDAEKHRQQQERYFKEVEIKRQQEAEEKKKAAEEVRQQAILYTEKRKQQREADEKAEILRIHQTTGGYIGPKTNGKYEVSSLESLTSTRPTRDWLCEYQQSHFMERISEIRECKQSGVRTMFAKMCFIRPSEKAILLQILSALKSTDTETARVVEYLMQRAGI